ASWPGNFAQNYKTVLCHAVNCSSTIADVEGVRELTERFPACVLVGSIWHREQPRAGGRAAGRPRRGGSRGGGARRARHAAARGNGAPVRRGEAGQRPRGRGVVAECEGQGSGATIGGMIDSVGRFSGMSAPGNRDKVF
ncbi:unnamed protein product, partial [Prorocentrum cordatum]